MSLSLRALPVVERWDCNSCTRCCRGTTILLEPRDLLQLRKQNWEEHRDFVNVRTVVRQSLLSNRYVLAKTADGNCVFLNTNGKCRIHELYGIEAKPTICQMFPLQLVPLEKHALVTSMRSCPSAARDEGRELAHHVGRIKQSGLVSHFQATFGPPPPITAGTRRSWRDYMAAANVLMRLTTDANFPMVRRLVHGLRFCRQLCAARLRRVKQEHFVELMGMLEEDAVEDAGDFFADRQSPSAATMFVFRQIGLHFIQCHPTFVQKHTWRNRWHTFRLSGQFARGRGQVPPTHPAFPSCAFADLEHPIGPLSDKVASPLNRFLETHVVSNRYAILRRKTSLTDSFRALALNFPMALWLLRLASHQRDPNQNDMVDIVGALERGQGVTGSARSARSMATSQQLERLLAWYVR